MSTTISDMSNMYLIQNEVVKVQVSSLGGELYSIFGKESNTEFLWQGDEKYWGGRSPILFPIVGAVPDDRYSVSGKTYSLSRHGFAWKSLWSVYEKQEDKIVFLLSSSDDTKQIYPFDFDFFLTYYLDRYSVVMQINIINKEKDREMLFSVGAHPGFNIPLEKGMVFEDYFLSFNKVEDEAVQIPIDDNLLLDTFIPFKETLTHENTLPLSYELFNEHIALILRNIISNEITLGTKHGPRAVTVGFNNYTHLGIWHQPYLQSPYVCIEPWCGVNSYKKDKKENEFQELATKEGIITLGVGDIFTRELMITIK